MHVTIISFASFGAGSIMLKPLSPPYPLPGGRPTAQQAASCFVCLTRQRLEHLQYCSSAV